MPKFNMDKNNNQFFLFVILLFIVVYFMFFSEKFENLSKIKKRTEKMDNVQKKTDNEDEKDDEETDEETDEDTDDEKNTGVVNEANKDVITKLKKTLLAEFNTKINSIIDKSELKKKIETQEDKTSATYFKRKLMNEFLDHIDDKIRGYNSMIADNMDNEDANMDKIKGDMVRQIQDEVLEEINNMKPTDLNIKKLTFGDDEDHIYVDDEDNKLNIKGNRLNIDVENVCINNMCVKSKDISYLYSKMLKDTGLQNTSAFIDNMKNFKSDSDYLSNLEKIKSNKFSVNDNDVIMYDNLRSIYKKNEVMKVYKNPNNFKYNPAERLYDKYVINFGDTTNTKDTGGILIKPPKDYPLMWLRVPYNQFTSVMAYYEKNMEPIGNFIVGKLWGIGPDGSDDDSFGKLTWMQIPIPKGNSSNIIVISSAPKDSKYKFGNLSVTGLAFTKNMWNNVYNYSFNFIDSVNGGGKLFFQHNFGLIQPKKVYTLHIPVIPSNKDKLLYMLTNDQYSNTTNIKSIKIGDKLIERFKKTYQSPFRNIYTPNYTFVAAKIPNNLIDKTAKYIPITFDFSENNYNISVLAIGTHDFIY